MSGALSDEAVFAPEFTFRRGALLILLGCVTASSVVSLILTPLFRFETFDVVGLALIVVKSAGLLLWLWRRPRAFHVVGAVELTLEVVGGLVKFAALLFVDRLSYGLGSYSLWLPLMYVVAALVLPARQALLLCTVLYAALLGMGVAFFASNLSGARDLALYGNALVQLYVMHAAFIAGLALLGRLRDAYVQAVRSARHHERLANVDALTGLPNRRQLTSWLQAELAAARGVAGAVSVVALDLDHFKGVNDAFGHDVGDEVLRLASTTMRATLREGDLFGRWGGEEFLMILPGCDLIGAQEIALRLQAALARVAHPRVGRVTVSCGVAEARPTDDAGTLLQRADRALYAAKDAGRDRVRALV